MQSFRRRRYQYVSAGIGRAYYGSLPRQAPRNGSHGPNNFDPTSPSTESSAHVPKNVKPPWRDINRTTPVSVEDQPKEHNPDQLDPTPQMVGEGSSVLVNTRVEREKSASHRATRASHSTKLSAQVNLKEAPTFTYQAARRTTSSKKLPQELRGHRFKKINADIRLEDLLPKYNTQEGLEIRSSAVAEGAEPLGGNSTSVPSQSASKAAQAAPERPGLATLINAPSSLHEDDSPQALGIEQFETLMNERSEMLAGVVTTEDELEFGHDVPHCEYQKSDTHPTIGGTSQPTPRQPISAAASAASAVPESPMPSVRHKRRARGLRSYSGPAKATSVVNEIDGKLLSQDDLVYGPAFAPYTTKLLNPTEGWEKRPALWDISRGCLLWLPPNYKFSEDTRLRHPHPMVLNHPIVVLSVDVSGPEDAIVTYMVIRSFKSLGAKTSTPSFWMRHLPISRFRRESWKDELETQESWKDAPLFRELYPTKTISRVQYVDIQCIYTARWEDLQCHTGRRHVYKTPARLSEKSMAQLRAARTWWEDHYNTDQGLVKWEDEWVPTQLIREVFRQRYIEPRREEDNKLGSVVAGKISNEVSERSDELVLKMEKVRAEIRAEFEDARDKMRAGLDKVRAETRSELMTEILAEVEDVREGLHMVNRAEKAVVELKVAKSARPPIPQPEYATSSQLAIWQAANDVPEWSDDLTRKVETMRVELELVRIEMGAVKAEMGGVRDEVEEMRGDMDKIKVELELAKRSNAAREAARLQKSTKMPDVGMYAPALGPLSPAARAALPSQASSDVSEGTAEATKRGLKEELEEAMSAPAQTAQPPTPVVSSLLQRTKSGPRLGSLAQSRG
ncbi:hypothetical protein ACLOAV_010632 [Pseudogymnoascus australis]